MCIEYPVWENTAQEAMVVTVNNTMRTCSNTKTLDVGAQATRKIVSQANLLNLVEQKSFIEVVTGFIGIMPYRWWT
jgi:adenylate kinase